MRKGDYRFAGADVFYWKKMSCHLYWYLDNWYSWCYVLFQPLLFQGGKIRDMLFQLLEKEEDVLISHGTQSRESRRTATRGMHTSKFCLNPAGDTPSACRLFDSIVSLCVPLIVSDSIELPFEDVIDYRKIAIFVDTESSLKPGYLVKLLRAESTERILEYQKEMREVNSTCIFLIINTSILVNVLCSLSLFLIISLYCRCSLDVTVIVFFFFWFSWE